MTAAQDKGEEGGDPPERPVSPRPRKRHRTGLGLRIFLVLLAFLVVVAGYGLTGRPIRLPVWAVAEVESRLNAMVGPVMPDSSVAIGGMEVAVDDDWVPRIRLDDLRLLKPDGAALLALPELRMSLDPAALLRGRLQPQSLLLSGARISVRRDAQGQYDFAFGGGGAVPQITSFAQLFDLADKAMAQPAAASLKSVEAEALTLRLTDDRTGRVWELGDGRMTVENRPDALAAELGVTASGAEGVAGRATLTLVTQKKSDEARLEARFDGISAPDLASLAPVLAPLGALDAPISGRLATTLRSAGLSALEGELNIGAGALRPTPAAQPVLFTDARIVLHLDPDHGRLVMDDLAVDGPALKLQADGQTYLLDAAGQRMLGPLGAMLPETFLTQIRFRDVKIDPEGLFQEPAQFSAGALDLRLRVNPFRVEVGQLALAEDDRRLLARGVASADAQGWTASFDLSLNKIAHDKLVALWPVRLVPKTREWVQKNILQGKLFDVKAALRILPGQEPRLHLGYSFENADVRFVPSLPPIREGYGYATIEGKTNTIVLSRGKVTPPLGGDIDMAGSVFMVPDITQKPAQAEIRLKARSSLTAALSLLDQPPFQFLTKADKPVDLGEGEAQLQAVLHLPLKPKVLVQDVTYQVTAQVSHFRSDVLVPGRVITADAMQVQADRSGLTISGPGLIGGVPFDATYHQGFAPEERGKARIEGTVALSQGAADEFGLGLPDGTVSGTGRANVAIDLQKNQPGKLRLTSNLAGITLRLPDVGWTKPAATAGRLEADVTLGATPGVERLVLDAASLKAEGAVSMKPGGGLDKASFPKVSLAGWLNGAVTITGRGKGRPVGLAMTSGTVDLRKLPPASARKGSGQGGGPLSLSLDRLVVAQSITLTGFRGDFSLAGGINGDFRAAVNGGAAVAGNILPAPYGTSVRLVSEDAGAVMRDAGIFQSAHGGKLSLVLVPRKSGGAYDGKARITGVRVRNANVLAELLNAISVVGLLEQLDGSGLVFAEVDGDLILTPNAVQITRGSAIGASLGVSMAGVYQSGSGLVDMQGVISPIYMLNGIGALLSKRGEGVFGFNYSLKGTATDPQVSVNPLSILTPGMFREIFRQPPPVVGESKE
ncbi:YhdP family protein [Fuscibacter oryzae]|uniref:YhdP central domain-containing protein n=1 Tax=Fuscibacter oryzae TaxID=2803939 RepID=A0A8J7MQ09_9RHOB|nr:DUF3971 domain-containing protein [Fuscibacter oryzae]MBL4927911.1 hypothetical protein [Fuscibacter oryzae]